MIPDTHETAPVNEDGEICISGPLVMMGYLNDDAETMQALRYHEDGRLWLHTGDVGYLGEDGLIYFLKELKELLYQVVIMFTQLILSLLSILMKQC